ncbi:MAG: hypothetical protein KDA67_02010 [Rhodobacteraceae bacterium]|nr:hypothetical protein [Paracoccaceae bacterium]
MKKFSLHNHMVNRWSQISDQNHQVWSGQKPDKSSWVLDAATSCQNRSANPLNFRPSARAAGCAEPNLVLHFTSEQATFASCRTTLVTRMPDRTGMTPADCTQTRFDPA